MKRIIKTGLVVAALVGAYLTGIQHAQIDAEETERPSPGAGTAHSHGCAV